MSTGIVWVAYQKAKRAKEGKVKKRRRENSLVLTPVERALSGLAPSHRGGHIDALRRESTCVAQDGGIDRGWCPNGQTSWCNTYDDARGLRLRGVQQSQSKIGQSIGDKL